MEISKVAGKACKAIFWHVHSRLPWEKTINSSGLSAEGALNFYIHSTPLQGQNKENIDFV